MAAAITNIGNGSGYLYVTKNNGTTILGSVVNNKLGASSIMAMGAVDFELIGSNSLEARRYFINTGGSEGSISGADEITEAIRQNDSILREGNITIATGVAYYKRQGSITVLSLNEEGGANDSLATITPKDNAGASGDENNYQDGDIVIVKKHAASNTIKVVDTGNIVLDGDADFTIANRHSDCIALQYSSGNSKFNELFRQPSAAYSVTKLRAANVPLDILGVTKISYTGSQSGTGTITSGTDENVIIVTSSGTIAAATNFTIPVPSGSPITGEKFVCYFNALVTKGAYTFTIFGLTLTEQELASGAVVVQTIYDGSGWNAVKVSSASGSNSVVTAMIKDGNITTAKIADKSITSSKLATGAQNGIIVSNLASSVTLTTGSEVTLVTLNIPAGTFSSGNAAKLRITAFGEFAAGTGTNTMNVKFGGTSIMTFGQASAATRSTDWKIESDVFRVSSNVQRSASIVHCADAAISNITTTSYVALTKTEASEIVLTFTVNQADASMITIHGLVVEAVASSN